MKKYNNKYSKYVLKVIRTSKHRGNDAFLMKMPELDGWGPENWPTDNIEDALKFDTKGEANYYIENCGWGSEDLIPLRVEIEINIKY